MDAFYASVEQRDTDSLKGKPVVVGGQPDSRGVVAACSYEARKFGVKSAMPCSQAYRLCPDAVFVSPRFDVYRTVSQQVRAIFERFSSVIEPLSLDEAYIDVSDVTYADGSATAIAQAIRQMIYSELGLTASAGVSYNKFLAKIASDENKPNGIFVVPPDDALAFIDKLAIKKFHGVGKVTEEKMLNMGIRVGKDLRRYSLLELQKQFGKQGQYFFNIARGIDNRSVKSQRERKSLGCERTYAEDLHTLDQVNQKLEVLVEKLSGMLIKHQLKAKSVTLKVKFADFSQITRTISRPRAIQKNEELALVASELLEKLQDTSLAPVRLLGLSASRFESIAVLSDTREIKPAEESVSGDRQLSIW